MCLFPSNPDVRFIKWRPRVKGKFGFLVSLRSVIPEKIMDKTFLRELCFMFFLKNKVIFCIK